MDNTRTYNHFLYTPFGITSLLFIHNIWINISCFDEIVFFSGFSILQLQLVAVGVSMQNDDNTTAAAINERDENIESQQWWFTDIESTEN